MNKYLQINKDDLNKEWKFIINIFREKFYNIPYMLIKEDFKNIDFGKFLANIIGHKLLLLLHDSIFPILNSAQKIIYNKVIQKEKNNTNNNLRELKGLIDIMHSKDIDNYIILKGLPLSKRLYDDIYARGSGDVDILLSIDDCIKLCDLLTNEYGFFSKFALENKDINCEQLYYNKKAVKYGYTHEIPLLKLIDNKQIFSIELKIASSAISFSNIHNAWKNVEMIIIDDTLQIQTINSHYDFIHLINNAFCNTEFVYGNKISLRDYFDICTFINKFSQYIDWNLTINEFISMHSLSKARITFKYLSEIMPDYIDESILELLFNDRINIEGYEYLIEKMFFPKFSVQNGFLYNDNDSKYKVYLQKTKQNYYTDPLFRYKTINCKEYANLDKYINKESVFTYFFYKEDNKLKINVRINSSLLENISTFYIDLSFLNLPDIENEYIAKQTIVAKEFKPVGEGFFKDSNELETNVNIDFYEHVKNFDIDHIHYRYNLICDNIEIERNYDKNAGLDIFYSVRIK